MGKYIVDFNVKLDKATSSRGPDGVPNVAVVASKTDEVFHKVESGTYHPHGRNPKHSAGGGRERFTGDTVCWIASCTKLMTTVAVSQCVERGLLNLDDDVGETWLPELKNPDILVRVDEDNGPAFRKATRKITLRFVIPGIVLIGVIRY
jgi:CubicO group peptidase (beta-lactamase class C family)